MSIRLLLILWRVFPALSSQSLCGEKLRSFPVSSGNETHDLPGLRQVPLFSPGALGRGAGCHSPTGTSGTGSLWRKEAGVPETAWPRAGVWLSPDGSQNMSQAVGAWRPLLSGHGVSSFPAGSLTR